MIIIALFLDLPVEKQDLRNKLKRIDYAGTTKNVLHVMLFYSLDFFYIRYSIGNGSNRSFHVGYELYQSRISMGISTYYRKSGARI